VTRFAMLLLIAFLPVVGQDCGSEVKGITRPLPLRRVQAEYDARAKAAKIEGSVKVTVVVSKEGKPRDAKITESLDPRLDANAVAAARQWEFRPATLHGKLIECRVVLDFWFPPK
jgi:TonB family protein